LDRNEATSDWIATVDSPALPARPMSVSPMMRRVDLRPHPARYLVALLRGRGGEQGGSRGDEPIGRARDRHRACDLRHAGIDQFESVVDLAESINTGGGGKNGEGADPEESEQQPPADAEIPASEFRTVACYGPARANSSR
jgi:hypothetical protein